jgi:hypothetical protein
LERDLLIPQDVEKRFVLLDRAAQSDGVLLKVSPLRDDAGTALLLDQRLESKAGVLYIPHGRTVEGIGSGSRLNLNLSVTTPHFRIYWRQD